MAAPRFVLANLAAAGIVTASTAVAGLPATNLQVPNRYALWRATGNSAQILVDLGSSKAVDFIGLVGLNGTAAMTRRVRVSTVANLASWTHDSGTATAGVDTEHQQWCYLLPSPATGRYVGLDLADSSLTQLDAGYLGVGLSWRPVHAHRHGGRRYVKDLSIVTQSDGGNTFVDERPKLRCWSFEMQIDRSESEGGAADLQALLLGRSRPLWAIRDPDAVPPASQLYWGLLQGEAELNDSSYGLRGMPMTLIERA